MWERDSVARPHRPRDLGNTRLVIKKAVGGQGVNRKRISEQLTKQRFKRLGLRCVWLETRHFRLIFIQGARDVFGPIDSVNALDETMNRRQRI
jgi:hypothetical protein